jgi:translation initiation factor 4G
VETTDAAEAASPDADSDSSVDDTPSPVPLEMSEESAVKKIDEDVKEFFAVRNTHEEAYFTDLLPRFRSKMVEKLVARVVEAKEADAELLAQFFANASSKDLCSPEAFEEGFAPSSLFVSQSLVFRPKRRTLVKTLLKSSLVSQLDLKMTNWKSKRKPYRRRKHLLRNVHLRRRWYISLYPLDTGLTQHAV